MDSNHRPRAYQARALTSWAISPYYLFFSVSVRLNALVEMMGFEPMTPCLQGRCSPSWATPPFYWVLLLHLLFQSLEWISPLHDRVSIELSSRTVSRKVFSPLQSLTSVFGMGTGGPSAFVALTSSRLYSLNIEQHFFSLKILIKPFKFFFWLRKGLFRSPTRSP